MYDATIVGAGPNGLAAAITLAQAGLKVALFESGTSVGGGCRSEELTLPGFLHDVCATIHPLARASPFFRRLPLDEHGLHWVQPTAPLAHPLGNGPAVVVERNHEQTAAHLGEDGERYLHLMSPLIHNWEALMVDLLAPLHAPRHPLILARFGLRALRSANALARSTFHTERARALFAGLAAHSMLPLEQPVTAAFGLTLGLLCHVVGWPIARGGSQQIADTLASCLRELGGEIFVEHPINHIDELPQSHAVLLDLTPRQVIEIAKGRLPPAYQRRLGKYRYGPGVFKVDWALKTPIPWQDSTCAHAATVHLGGSMEEIAASVRVVWEGNPPRKPFVILAQQTLFDPARAPLGKHTAWAYCHVPHASDVDMTESIEEQVERFAPGFRKRILARSTKTARDMQEHNPNFIGGDINGGVQDLRQHFSRPVSAINPYLTPVPGLFLCSSSTPPGGGVHGMCGYHAARVALKRLPRENGSSKRVEQCAL